MSAQAVLESQFTDLIAAELGCRGQQVLAAAALFAKGATVPFVARYRKEATGGLADGQLETIAKRRQYFLELAARRESILSSIAEQGKLSGELEKALRSAVSKQELEDLYLPFKPKRRTRAQVARERGLEPLADELLEGARRGASPNELAARYVEPERGVEDIAAALAGAQDILAERLAESPESRAFLRRVLARDALLEARLLPAMETQGAVYRDYFEHSEPAASMPSHRLLAVLRGEREGVLVASLAVDDEAQIERLAATWQVPLESPCGRLVAAATADGYRRLLRPSIATQVRGELRQKAEEEAIAVFRANLEALLLQAPLGQVPVMGLDPGHRTGCKLAVVDSTGRVLDTAVIYSIPPRADEAAAAEAVVRLVRKHAVEAVAVGNGTGCRETERFARRALQEAGYDVVVVAIVPETGASVYSASAVARRELPELDVALRGAVSIARRLQDPLAELVKIEPRSLGVGQYQHDVSQKSLSQELDLAVERVVNRVGVELNTASAELLRRVSSLSPRLAETLVRLRDERGPFRSREALLEVPGLGPRTFEQSAGFLRIRGGENPLDATAVHPERYGLVARMAFALGVAPGELVGNPAMAAGIDLDSFVDEAGGVGRFTLEDIRSELERPGRDPRPDFEAPRWHAEVSSLEDLRPGMTLEGRISNVTNFGAFVDIGVKRDGLVHVSELSHRWIENPREAVTVGQVVRVQVLEVDRDRGRISLSMKALAPLPRAPSRTRSRDADDTAPRGRPESERRQATIQDLVEKFSRR